MRQLLFFPYVHHSIEIQKSDLALPLIFIYHSGVFFNDQCTFPTWKRSGLSRYYFNISEVLQKGFLVLLKYPLYYLPWSYEYKPVKKLTYLGCKGDECTMKVGRSNLLLRQQGKMDDLYAAKEEEMLNRARQGKKDVKQMRKKKPGPNPIKMWQKIYVILQW